MRGGITTDTAARNAQSALKLQRLWDRDGLYLEVAPSGGKWWRFKYRFAGKEKRLSVGVYPEASLNVHADLHLTHFVCLPPK